MRVLRALAANVLVPLGIAAVLFLLLEGGCRAALRVKTGKWPETRAEAYTKFVEHVGRAYRPHPYLVVAARPDAVLEAAGKVVHFNARGHRATNVRDLAVPKPAGAFRILCAGGSSTFDLLAPDDAATWPARLGTLLAPRAEVANAGFPGWTSLESLVSLEIRDVELTPDLVIVYSGVNDLQPAGHVPFTPDYSLGHADILPRVTGIVPIPVRLASRSVLAEQLLGRLKPRGPAPAEGFAPAWAWSGPRQADVPEAAVAVYERNLTATIGVARAHGARVLLVPQTLEVRAGTEARDVEWIEAWCPGLTADAARRGLARYADVMRRLASSPDVLFLPPYDGASAPEGDFDDACHFSVAGSDRFARRVAAFLTSPGGPLSVR